MARAVERWGITLGGLYEVAHPGNLVYRCTLPDGIHAVIKTEPEWTGDDGFFTGLDALLLYSGRGMVQVLEVSREERTVLLERIEPGETLWSARLLHRIGPLG